MFFKKVYLPVQLFFILVLALVVLLKRVVLPWDINLNIVLIGNAILFFVTMYSLYFYQKAMAHPFTMGFLRNTYSGILIKLFVCMIAVLIYALNTGGALNKGGLLICIALYLIYALLEMRSLLRWNKERKNA